MMCPWQCAVLSSAIVLGLAISAGAASQDSAPARKFYRVVDGKVDARTYNGFRRYHAGCNHCHGPDGMGSTFAPPLVGELSDIETFRRVVRDGQRTGASVMKGFAADPNIAPYVDDIYAYLQARADGALGRGRPIKLEQSRRSSPKRVPDDVDRVVFRSTRVRTHSQRRDRWPASQRTKRRSAH